MRRLKAPTLAQWGCTHRWKTTHSLPQKDALHRIRYHKCLRCGLRVKTEERLTVPYNERDLLALVRAILPEGKPVHLREQGITELPLYGLNTLLARQGYVIHAVKVRDPKRFVACTDKQGRVERFGLFELRRILHKAPGGTDRRRGKGKGTGQGKQGQDANGRRA